MTLQEVQAEIRKQISETSNIINLTHAVAGICEEAGEVAGLLKRQDFMYKEVSRDRWVDELGDVLWYLTATAEMLQLSLDDIFNYNKRKLDERYGQK